VDSEDDNINNNPTNQIRVIYTQERATISATLTLLFVTAVTHNSHNSNATAAFLREGEVA